MKKYIFRNECISAQPTKRQTLVTKNSISNEFLALFFSIWNIMWLLEFKLKIFELTLQSYLVSWIRKYSFFTCYGQFVMNRWFRKSLIRFWSSKNNCNDLPRNKEKDVKFSFCCEHKRITYFIEKVQLAYIQEWRKKTKNSSSGDCVWKMQLCEEKWGNFRWKLFNKTFFYNHSNNLSYTYKMKWEIMKEIIKILI